MATFYDDSDETPIQRDIQDAPEAVNRLSPSLTRSSIDGELRRHYSARSAPCPSSPIDHDTEKEVVTCFQMDSRTATCLQENPPAPQVVSPIDTMASAGPRTIWRSETIDLPSASFENAGRTGPENMGAEDPDKRDCVGSVSKKREIMGMRRNVFLMSLIILVLVVVGLAVGGGVACSLASKKNNSASTTPSTSATSSTSAPDINFLNNQTWSDDGVFAFQGFAKPNFNGVSTPIFTGDGTKDFAADLQFDVHSFAWVPNYHGCCVNLCANSTRTGRIGFVCGRRKERATMRAVMRVFVWCADVQNGAISEEKGCGGI